jgi:DNA-binding NtrC family response regulator
VASGEFREDLYYRLRVIHLHVPALRERPEDVQELMKQFLARAGRDLTFADDAKRVFLGHRWPGNVRELLNVLEQLLWLSPTGVVQLSDLPASLRAPQRPEAPDDRPEVADELYDALVKQGASFWGHVYPMFLARDITRHDLRELVRRGLQESKGRYKALISLFGMSSTDYRRFMNFLAAHECSVAVREFRGQASPAESPADLSPTYVEPEDLPVVAH